MHPEYIKGLKQKKQRNVLIGILVPRWELSYMTILLQNVAVPTPTACQQDLWLVDGSSGYSDGVVVSCTIM